MPTSLSGTGLWNAWRCSGVLQTAFHCGLSIHPSVVVLKVNSILVRELVNELTIELEG